MFLINSTVDVTRPAVPESPFEKITLSSEVPTSMFHDGS
jgi:hypothetical protein